jgi:hypothetical protein
VTKENTMTNLSNDELHSIHGGGQCYSISLSRWGIPIGISVGSCEMEGGG